MVQANKKCGIVEACRILCFDMNKAHPYEAGYPIAMLLATAIEMINEEELPRAKIAPLGRP